MAFKMLGGEEIDGVANAINTDILLYTVPASKYAIVSTIHCLNKHSTDDAIIRVMTTVSGDEWKILYNEPLWHQGGANHISIQLGICMAVGDKIYVRSDKILVNFMAWGEEGDA